ncbi:MFS transporter [Marinomonas ostreistagni]|uniref:MFS transporter n=1 Tax=Marinomonas ostreistagni TaxID=359209 RepID=UPI00194FF066|nr:MFS transporter [Marinomonas ostreistagni]MBM6551883.1 MFS transporter [Marinomonas ostreistagni]
MPNTPTSQDRQTTAWPAVFLLWFAGISAAMQFAKFSVSYNDLLEHYQMGPALTGASLSVVGIVGLILGATAGIMAGRIGYRRVLIGSLLFGALLSFIQALLPPFEIILLTRVLEGFSQLGVVVAAPTMIARLSAPHHRSITMGIWGTFFGVAFAIAGSAGKFILTHYALSGLYLSHALYIVLMAVLVWRLIDNDEGLYNSPQANDSESYFRKLARIYQTPRTFLPALVFLFYTCTLVSLLTYIPNFIQSDTLRLTMQVVLPLMSTVGTFSAGALAQYVMRPQYVAWTAYIALALGALAVPYTLDYDHVFSINAAFMIFFLGMIPGAALSMVPRLARNSDEQANGYGLIAQLGNLGGAIGPPSFAALISAYGATGMISMIWVICAFGAVFAWMAARTE